MNALIVTHKSEEKEGTVVHRLSFDCPLPDNGGCGAHFFVQVEEKPEGTFAVQHMCHIDIEHLIAFQNAAQTLPVGLAQTIRNTVDSQRRVHHS